MICALLAGCSGVKVIDFDGPEEVKPFHPPLPAPVTPVVTQPVVVTPERAKHWLAELEEGEKEYFVVYGFNAQDWLTLGQYDQRKDYYIRQLLEIIRWYGHPGLQDDDKETGQ